MNCALCSMFIQFRRFLVSTWPDFAGFGVVSTAIHGANAWWVLELDFQLPLPSHINAIFTEGLWPLAQAYTFDCGEVNKQIKCARCLCTHRSATVSSATCQNSLGARVYSTSHWQPAPTAIQMKQKQNTQQMSRGNPWLRIGGRVGYKQV